MTNTVACGLAALALAGCEHEAVTAPPDTRGGLLHFTAGIGNGGETGEVPAGAAQSDAGTAEDVIAAARDALLKKTFVWSGDEPHDIIRVCNVENNTESPDFELTGERTYQYECSKYVGKFEDTGSDEEDDSVSDNHTTYSEYEFKPHGKDGFYIRNLVDDGNNYFRLFAAWWRGYSHPKADGTVPAGIAADQSAREDFLNSDLLMAFVGHNIEAFEEPIRLVFHHSLSMLDVRVEVPVYVPGDKGGEEESLPSGYKMEDVRMSMTNVPTKFTVSSASDINGGELVGVVPTDERVGEIPMYRYYVEDEDKGDGSPGDTGHEGEDVKGDESQKSRYRTYGFCGILPPMAVDTEHPLVRLHLKDPLTGKEEAYIYIPTQEAGSGGLALSGGHISVVRLKLYRSMKEMLVLSAEVEPWEKATGTLDMMEEGPVE